MRCCGGSSDPRRTHHRLRADRRAVLFGVVFEWSSGVRAGLFRYQAVMRKITDGDSVRADLNLGFNQSISNRDIRLFGIDTPELRSRSDTQKRMARAARAVLEEKIPAGSEFILESQRDKSGKYGRVLARLWVEQGVGWLCLNDHLLKIKLAQAYDGKSKRSPWDSWYEDHASEINPLLERYAA